MALDKGTPGNDTLTGTQFDDHLFGLAGNDVLRGLGGNDTLCGGAGRDRLSGGEGNDQLLGNDGNDTLIGAAGADAFEGGAGNDLMVVSSALVASVKGGAGVDTVRLDALGTSIDLTGALGDKLANIEKLDLGGKTANTLVLSTQAVLDMAGGGGALPDDTLLVKGNLGDSVNLQGDWTKGAMISDPFGETGSFDIYTSGAAKVLVESELAVLTDVPGALDLATLDGKNGFTLTGIAVDNVTGRSVSWAGDVNGDGFADMIVGAPNAGPYAEGESYVVFGKESWSGTPSLDVTTLDGTNGFRLLGIDSGDLSGRAVSSAGDVNGDGFADLIVGANYAEGPDKDRFEGESYVVFGKASWVGTPSLDLATLDGTSGFRLIGIDAYDRSGASVSSAGDVNGDGFDDFLVGTFFAESASPYEGESYVVFGKATWAGVPAFDLAALDGTNGFRVLGADGDVSGFSVASAGDVNGDGFGDVIVGALGAGEIEQGESYVVFGKASWVGTPSFDPATLDGTNGFALIGIGTGDQSGFSVSSAGDVNGDGFDDAIVGGPNAGPYDEGESYVVFGKASWAGTPAVDLAALDGTNGFQLNGIDAFDRSGWSVSSAGDVNGDGFADLIVGAPFATSEADGDGESYVVYGKADWASVSSLDLATLDGTDGFRLIGSEAGDGSGRAVSSAGDVNGDGFADLIVGSLGAGSPGKGYVVFGGNFTGAVTHLGTTGDDTLTGSAAAESFVGGTGNDLLIGNGGADAFQGGAGDDVVRVSSLDFHVADGGTGSDTLALEGSGLHLDLTALADNRTRSIERIDIGGDGNNTLTLSVLDVLHLSDESNELLVLGNSGDVVNRGAGWTAAASGGTNGNGTSTIDGQTYQIYGAGQAMLLIDTDMTAIT
jgi:hypothetical protein